MYIFDLHCDTLTACLNNYLSLIENKMQLDVTRGNGFDKWIQTFACFLDDSLQGAAAWSHFEKQRKLLIDTVAANGDKITIYNGKIEPKKGQCTALLAVEGGQVLGGNLNNVSRLKEMGVAFLTLTWNKENEIGCGSRGNGGGLTTFGKQVIPEMERCNVIVDVSHLNEEGFSDVCELATKPIIATHSNARSVHEEGRNLRDQQLDYIIKCHGLCGINFYPAFVNGQEDCGYTDLRRHIDHIFTLGGEDIIALGSDFDGAPMPAMLNGVETLHAFYDEMLKWYDTSVVNKIFYQNAKNFMEKNVTL